MASSWGVSWGSSWGISWGATGPTPVIISVPFRDGRISRRMRNKQRNIMYQALTEDEELVLFISDFMKNV